MLYWYCFVLSCSSLAFDLPCILCCLFCFVSCIVLVVVVFISSVLSSPSVLSCPVFILSLLYLCLVFSLYLSSCFLPISFRQVSSFYLVLSLSCLELISLLLCFHSICFRQCPCSLHQPLARGREFSISLNLSVENWYCGMSNSPVLFSDVVLNIAALPPNVLETLPTGRLLLVVTGSPDHMMLNVNSSLIRHEIVSNHELSRVIQDVERDNGTTLSFESPAGFRWVSYSGDRNILVAPNPQLAF